MRVGQVVLTGFPRQAGMWAPINTSGASSEPAHPAGGNTEPSSIPRFWATEPALPPQKRIQSRPNKSFHSQRHPHAALPTQICIQAQWPSLGQQHSISNSASPCLWSTSAPLPPSRTTPPAQSLRLHCSLDQPPCQRSDRERGAGHSTANLGEDKRLQTGCGSAVRGAAACDVTWGTTTFPRILCSAPPTVCGGGWRETRGVSTRTGTHSQAALKVPVENRTCLNIS